MSFNSGMKGADVVALLKNGLPIVDDVNKLDPNAEIGSMASVAIPGNLQETSLSELPQPDASIVDYTTMVLNASTCPLASGLSVIVPTSAIPVTTTISEQEMICFVSESVDLGNSTFGTMLGIMPLIQNGELSALMAMYMDVTTMAQSNFTLFSITDGVVTADQDAINQVDTLINGLHYIGAIQYTMGGQTLPSEILDVYDMVVKAVTGIPSITDVYVKGDNWEPLHKKDLEKLAKDLEACKGEVTSVTESKADKITIDTYYSGFGLQPNVYTKHSVSKTGSVSIKLADIEDTTVYSEYILELKCTSTPSSVSFANESGTSLTIKWANDTSPIFEAGYTYLISIANNFGVFAQYVNS